MGDEAVKTHCIVVNLANVAAVAKSRGAAEDSIDMCSVKGNEAFKVCLFDVVDFSPTSREHRRRRHYDKAAAFFSVVEDLATGSAQARALRRADLSSHAGSRGSPVSQSLQILGGGDPGE